MSRVKTKKEIERIERSAKIAKSIFAEIKKEVRPGAREKEIAKTIESAIRRRGLKRSFRTIVAGGPNAANPHARLTERKIKTNDMVVVDFGVVYKGFCSDMTRTVIVGRADARMRKLYKTVKTAQESAIRKVRPGLAISELARGAHDYIRKKRLGKYIRHTLGHGLGRKIHEAPKLSEKNRKKLKKNMVITIEPGLYIKGKGGVRIEDMVHVTRNGGRILTR